MAHVDSQLFVSVVIYQPALPQLAETLNSVLKSTLPCQISVVDNDPQSNLKSFFADFPQVQYSVNSQNLGFGKAHNQNIAKNAKNAGYVLILNPDVYFDQSLLTELLKRMEQDSSIGVCIPRICHPGGEIQRVNRRIARPIDYVINFLHNRFKLPFLSTPTYEKYLLADIDQTKPFQSPIISGCFMFFRRQAFAQVSGFDERFFLYLEDADLSRRVAALYKTVVFGDLVAFHHWSRGAYKNVHLFKLFVTNLLKYFNKWGWFYDSERAALNRSTGPYKMLG